MKKTYTQFYNELLAWYRKNMPNSSLPRDHVISSLYDDYEKNYKEPNVDNSLALKLPKLKIYEIAQIIENDWKKVNYAAKPYLDAMHSLSVLEDKYIADSGASIVAYFISNANTWKGETAKAVKKELNKRLKIYYGR